MNRILTKSILALLALLALSACGGGAGSTGFTPGYRISGTLTGIAGRAVVLNDGTENLTVTGNGATAVSFSFPTWLADGATYAVTAPLVSSPGQDCTTISGGSNLDGTGTIAAAHVTDIVVTCTPISYQVGVIVTGVTGFSVTLQNNLTPIAAITTDGTYATAFPNQNSGTGYNITVSAQPTGVGAPFCSVSNNSGTIVAANIVATVTCKAPCSNCSVGGTITGLQVGESIALQVSINGAAAIAVPLSPFTTNVSFTAATGLVSNDTYNVSIATQPANQPCSATYGAGTIKAAGVTNVNVFCGYNPRGGFAPAANMGTTTRQNHTATLLGNGKVLVAGGYTSAGTATNSATLYDPATNTWTSTGSLSAARYSHTATLLNTGKVLVVGGFNGTSTLSSAEIYDPGTGVWTLAADLSAVPLAGRYLHTATLLADGKVLVAGGYNVVALSTSAVYNPTNNTWAVPTGTFTGRYGHTATLLTDLTDRVLVVGGTDGANPLGVVEYYDPAANSWSADTALTGMRYLHTATLLSNGKVLVAGGVSGGVTIGSAEIYTPTGVLTAGSWASAGTLNNVRYSHTATLLTSNNKVLVIGGCNVANTCASTAVLASAEIYDPVTNAWTAAGSLAGQRYQHAAVLLGNGKVLVSGGSSGADQLATAELFDPAMIGWSTTGNLATTRYRHTTTRLDGPGGGKVLVAGGFSGPAGSGSETSSSELYDALGGAATPTTGNLNVARYDHTATLLADGKVLVAGGYAGTAALASSELYNPATGLWTATTGALSQKRSQHTATLLNDGTGRVLVAGGWDGVNAAALTSAELYDPVTQTWSTVDSLTTGRYQHTATLLPDGRVLVAGGVSSGTTTLISAEVFDPSNPSGSGIVSWTTVGPMPSAHRQHAATLLPNGTVLVAGGMSGASKVATSAIFTPVSNNWVATTGGLAAARTLHTATLLPSGKVLVTGGLNTAALATAELYNAGTWTQADDLLAARYQHAATLLQNGQLLVTGGYNGTTTLGTAELGW